MGEPQMESDNNLLDAAIDALKERFQTVVILASRYDPHANADIKGEEPGEETLHRRSCGPYYHRRGMLDFAYNSFKVTDKGMFQKDGEQS